MTIKQTQCLLAYLGLYGGGIDGIRGAKTIQAEREFEDLYGGASLLEAVCGTAAPSDPWEGIRYFSREELRCRCGGKYCDGFPAQPNATLLRLADRVRGHFGAKALVSSGLRCATHNANVGGAAASRHMQGKALDFRVEGRTADTVLAFVKAQPETRYAYSIDGTYLHMDVT